MLTAADGTTSVQFQASDFAALTECDHNQYDASLNLFYDRTIDANGHHTDTYKDAEGRAVRTVYDDGSFTETLYGFGSQAVSKDQEGDSFGNPGYNEGWNGIPTGGQEVVNIAQRKTGDPLVITYDLYDAAGRLTDVWQPAVVDADPTSPTYNQTVRPHYHYGYDAAGNQISQSDARNHLTTFGYDQNGSQVRRTLPDGEQETYTYDQYARKATHVDFDGNTATYSYYPAGDPHAGMPSQAVYVGAANSGKATQSVAYTYDSLGRVQTVTDASGTTTNHYDAMGYLTQEDTPEGVIHHVYNAAGQHTETYTDNTHTIYDYDSQGRLWHVTVTKLNGVTLTTPLITTYGYDAAGNKASEVLPNGVTTVYIYDDLNRLTDLVQTRGTQTLFTQHYTLRHDGLRSASAEAQLQPDGSTVTISTSWTYDNLGRLTGETVTSSQSGQSFTDTYTFDLSGNRMTKTHVGPGGGGNESITYTYNNDDQLTKQVSSLSGETDFYYDANGSQTSSVHAAQTTTYTYNVRNKMVAIAVGGVTTATYIYDNGENRVSETTGGVTTLYLTDKDNPTGYARPIEAKPSSAGAPVETYILGDRVVGQADGASALSYQQVDGHGSTRALTSSSGAVICTFNYDAFGGAINFTPATAGTVFLFGGDAVYDPASGMYFHGNGVRTRDGFRFLQRDTYRGNRQDPRSLHKYLYVQANPIMGWDPSGHFLDLLFGTGGGVAVEGEGLALAGGAYGEALEVKAAMEAVSLTEEAIADTAFSELQTEILARAVDNALTMMILLLAAWQHGYGTIGGQIANGHAGDKHLHEFDDLGIGDNESLGDFVDDVIKDAKGKNTKDLKRGRKAYYDPESGTIVVVSPNDPDGGTTYRPEYGDPPRDPDEVWDELE